MGYNTDFAGKFDLDRPLAPEHAAYLRKFNQTRRMRRNAEITDTRPDPLRLAVGLPVGEEGGYFVGTDGSMGQEFGAADILDYNVAPVGQPELWCNWTPNDTGTAIEWDGGEKFYGYIPWIKYLIRHFLEPWGYVLNGEVEWWGEEQGDTGTIMIEDNSVTTE